MTQNGDGRPALDVDGITTQRDLLDRLQQLRVSAARGTGKVRVSLRDLARASGVPHSSLGKYFSGASVMPADVLDAVVLALGVNATEARAWATAWERVANSTVEQPVAGPRSVPRQLPAAVAAFSGRQAAFDHLDGLLAAGAGPAVVISAVAGAAGVGKTALAVMWGHRVADRFPDGQLYLNLRGYGPGEPLSAAAALEYFLRSLGIEEIPAQVDERAARYRSGLSGKRMLIVLDNAVTVAQVRPLLPGEAGCTVVVTSRDSMPALVALDGARRLVLDRLPADEALELLARLLGGARVAAEPEACADLVRVCAGLPLALRVAAERIVDRVDVSLTELVAELDRAGLDGFASDDPLADVRAVFAWSYRALPEPVASLFRLLGLVPGPDVDMYAAASLAGLAPATARRHLETLAGAHLLERGSAGRYTFHDLLRAYAAELCQATETEVERRGALTRYLDWYLHTVMAAMDLVNPNRHRSDVPGPAATDGPGLADAHAARVWLAAERAGLLAATRHAAESGWPGHAWRFCQALGSYYFMDGHTDDWAESHRYGLAAAEAVGDSFGQAEIWQSKGIAAAVAGRFDEALAAMRQALRFRQAVGNPGQRAATVGNLACVLHDLGQLREATEMYRLALSDMRATGNQWGEAMCLTNLGVAAADLGRHREAVDQLTAAWKLHRDGEASDAADTARALSSIAYNLSHVGEHERALATATESVTAIEELGATKFLTGVLNNLGVVHRNRAAFDQAEQVFRRALDIAHDIADHSEQTTSLVGLGVNALLRGDPRSGLELLAEAQGVLDGQDQNRWGWDIARYLGDCRLALGDRAAARDHYEHVLASDDDCAIVARGHAAYGMARLALLEDPPAVQAARDRLREAQRILAEAETPVLERQIGSALAALGELDELGEPVG